MTVDDRQTSTGDTWLEPWHRVLIVSKTRSGKSVLANVVESYFVNQTVVFVDVKRRYLVHGAVVVHGVDELYALTQLPARIHFVPIAVSTPGNRNAEELEYNALFAWCLEQHDLTVHLDECVPMPAPATGAPGMLRKYVGQAAVNRNGMIACTGRWRGVMLDLKAHADVIVMFPGGLAVDELDDAAKEMALGRDGVKPRDELRELLEQAKAIGPYACLWWDRNRDTFRVFQLPEHLLERAIATEVAPA